MCSVLCFVLFLVWYSDYSEAGSGDVVAWVGLGSGYAGLVCVGCDIASWLVAYSVAEEVVDDVYTDLLWYVAWVECLTIYGLLPKR